jgi:sigma-B regulation protein RsbU (phosphoserine phosphatase)
MFVTMFVGVLDLPTGRLRYCNAGHDRPVIVGRDELPVIANLPIGLFNDFRYEQQETTLGAGDMLFLYTDGLTEAMNPTHQQFTQNRMMTILDASAGLSPEELLAKMSDEVRSFAAGAEQSDDLTMMAIRYTPRNEESVLDETLTLKNDVRQVKQLNEFIKSVAEQLGMDASLAKKLRLAVEEAVVNVIDYAYPPGTEGDITVRAMANSQRLKLIISDEGTPFDPTEKALADTTLSAEERPVGGLGILLVRKLMDSINYEYIDGKNVLTLRKNLTKNNKTE